MQNISPIESFIKKYRAAIADRNKDIRISIEEATDIVAAFATINTSGQDLNKSLIAIVNEIKGLKSNTPTESTSLDGGKFK